MFTLKNTVIITIVSLFVLSGCARDLSSNVYTSDSTLGLTLEGEVLSVRAVIIKESDKLGGNGTGIMTGTAAGIAAGSNLGGGNGKAGAMVAGAIVGGVIGAVVESNLGEQDGLEYIIKVDTSKLKSDYYEGSGAMRKAISSATTSGLVTIVQGKDILLTKGQQVYVIFSEKRARIIPAS